jgi:transcriptional regulator with XRE-family HTH domain
VAPATTIADIEREVRWLFAQLDAERFDAVASRLAPDVELADEITGDWLRGERRVAAYLGAQHDVVTDVRSELSSLRCRFVASSVGLATFDVRQHYQLDRVPHSEVLTGSAVFSFTEEPPRIQLLHLGTGANPPADEGGAVLVPAPSQGALRNRRIQSGLSLRDLARASGLSAGYISQIERRIVVPSEDALRRLAEALGTSLEDLRSPEAEVRSRALVREVDRIVVEIDDLQMRHESLVRPGEGVDAFIGTLARSATMTAGAEHDSPEFLLVLMGRLHVSCGEAAFELSRGDALVVRPRTPHGLRALGDGPARFLSVRQKETL